MIPPRPTTMASVTKRARMLFFLLLGFLIASQSWTLYEGTRTGELKETVLEPAQQLLASTFAALKETVKSSSTSPTRTPVRIETNITVTERAGVTVTTTNNGTTTTKTYTAPRVGATGSTSWSVNTNFPNSNEARRAQDEWWAGVQAENQRLAEESKRSLQEFRDQSLQTMEAFKQESARKTEEFREKYGFE